MSLLGKFREETINSEENSWITNCPKKEPSTKFDLYFAGSHSNITKEILTKCGACRLSSQIRERSIISQWIDSLKNGETTGKLMIDSGAHTMFYTGGSLDSDEYAKYLNSLGEYVTIFVQADKIPNYEGSGRARNFDEAPLYNWANYLYMRERVNYPDKLLPVYHIGEGLNHLQNMLDWRGPKGEKVEYVGISPRQEDPWAKKVDFMHQCFNVIKKSSNPNIKTHALGMTKLTILESLPFTSADSTSWLLTGAMGGIMTPDGIISVSELSTHNPSHYLRLPKEGREKINRYVESYGLTMPLIAKDYNARIALNIMYLTDWAREYEYKPVKRLIQKTLF